MNKAQLTQLSFNNPEVPIFGAIAWSECNLSNEQWSKDKGRNLWIDANGCFSVAAKQVCWGFNAGVTIGACYYANNDLCVWGASAIKPISWSINGAFGTKLLSFVDGLGWRFGNWSNVGECQNM